MSAPGESRSDVDGVTTPDAALPPRQYAALGPIVFEGGGWLPAVTLAYESWGTLAQERDNAILVLHGLTGDSHAAGEGGWWSGVIGPGLAIDTDRFFVVAPNALGGCHGSTGPASPAPDGEPWGSRFPAISVRDQVSAEIMFADALGIERWALVIGGSAGGARALEWAVSAPDRVRRLAVLACGAATTADQTAWALPQHAAIRNDPEFHGGDYYHLPPGSGPHRGLGLARQIAHTTYRSAAELDRRFAADDGAEPGVAAHRDPPVRSYLEYQADKLVQRFDANSYLVLSEALLTHDVGRGRGGVGEALSAVRAVSIVIAVDTDRLFRMADLQALARAMPGCQLLRISSERGHDGFLVEQDQISTILASLLGT